MPVLEVPRALSAMLHVLGRNQVTIANPRAMKELKQKEEGKKAAKWKKEQEQKE